MGIDIDVNIWGFRKPKHHADIQVFGGAAFTLRLIGYRIFTDSKQVAVFIKNSDFPNKKAANFGGNSSFNNNLVGIFAVYLHQSEFATM